MINTCSLTSGKMINTCSLLPVKHEIHPSGPNALFISRQKLRPLRHVSKHSFFSGQIPVYSLGGRVGPPPPPHPNIIPWYIVLAEYQTIGLPTYHTYLIWPPSGRKKKKNHWQPCNLTKRCWDEMTLLLSYHRFRPWPVKGTVSWDFQPFKQKNSTWRSRQNWFSGNFCFHENIREKSVALNSLTPGKLFYLGNIYKLTIKK